MHFRWKAARVFYGWWIVAASFLVALYVGGVVFYGFTAIFEPIADDLGWSYTQISLAASLRGIEMSLLAPVIGMLVDRLGPRKLVFGGAIMTAAGLALLSRTDSLAMFYGAFFVITIGMSGCSLTVLMTAIANWFRRSVGKATGVAASGFGFGGLVVPLVVRLIDAYDWRTAMLLLGLGMLVLVLPLALLFRHRPEQYGYLPDGEAVPPVLDSAPTQAQTGEVNVGAREALRRSTFWRMAVGFTYHVLVLTAVVTHVMPYLSSIGVARAKASVVATLVPVTSIAGRLGFGWLGDRFDRRRLAAIGFAMMGLGTLCFAYAAPTSPWLLILFVALFGIGYGANNVLRPSLVRELFGRTSFGAVLGFMIGINMLGGIVGPPLAGWVFDNWGSYQGIWLLFAGLGVAAVVSILTVPHARLADQD